MATVAFDLLLLLSRRTGELVEGDEYVATGGGAATLVATILTQADDAWNNRTLFITYDAAGAGAAPEKQSRTIIDFKATSDELSVSPQFSAAVAVGDKFAIGSRKYNKGAMLSALNSAFRWFGPTPMEDVSLTTADATIEYTLPTGVPDDGLREVWIASSTSSPYDYVPISYWHINYGERKLIFNHQPPQPYKLKLVYQGFPSALTSDSSAVDSIYSPAMLDAIVEYAMGELMLRRIQKTSNPRPSDRDKYNLILQQAEDKRRKARLPQVPAQTKYWWTNPSPSEDDFRFVVP